MQELLEVMGIPYTGSGVSACIRAADKVLAKHAMRDRGIPTPDFYAFNETAFRELGAAQALPAIEERLQFPIVVKPAGQGSALGIKFARTAADVPAALIAAFSYDRKVLLERYVAGRDLAVSIIDDASVPPGAADRGGRPGAGGLLRLRVALRVRAHAVRVPGRARARRRRARQCDRAGGLRAARMLGLRARGPDDRPRRSGRVRARGQHDPRSDRDVPAPPGGRRGGDRFRRADRAYPPVRTAAHEDRDSARHPADVLRASRGAHDDARPCAVSPAGRRLHRSRAAGGGDERPVPRAAADRRAERRPAAAPGDCLATEVAGVPLLLVRGEDADRPRLSQHLPPPRRARVHRPRQAGAGAQVPVSLVGLRPRRRAARSAAGARRVRGARPLRASGSSRVPVAERFGRDHGAAAARTSRSTSRPSLPALGPGDRRTSASTRGASSTSAAAFSTPTGS